MISRYFKYEPHNVGKFNTLYNCNLFPKFKNGFTCNLNSKTRKWRHDSDKIQTNKQTGMADDFPKTLSKTAGVPKTHFWNENLRIARFAIDI